MYFAFKDTIFFVTCILILANNKHIFLSLYNTHLHPVENILKKHSKKHVKNLEVGIKCPYLCTRKRKNNAP